MKKINLIIIVLLLIINCSCDNMEDNYKEYLTESVYPGKIDSLRTYIGLERVYLAWDIPTDSKAEKIVVKFGNDSIISESIIDTIIVEGLNSGAGYKFEIYSIDTHLNKSVKEIIDLWPISLDWVDKNMLLPAPSVKPTDGINVDSLTLKWTGLTSDLMTYNGGLEHTLKDVDGNVVTSDVIIVDNNITNGALSLTLKDLEFDKEYELSYNMKFSPKVDREAILDSVTLAGVLKFKPSDYAIEPVYILIESNGWDESSFIEVIASEVGVYLIHGLNLIAGDVLRIFDKPTLSSEKQYGFSDFNTVTDLLKVSDDGNDNLQLTHIDGVYDIFIDTNSKEIKVGGTFNGLIQIPGRLESENFNVGGQGVGYLDNDASNNGGQFRNEGVDISSGPGDSFNVGWTGNGEWMLYTVEVSESGDYDVDFSVASPCGGPGQLILEFDGEDKLLFSIDATGGWGSFQMQNGGVINLEAGIHRMKIKMVNPCFNIDAVVFTKL